MRIPIIVPTILCAVSLVGGCRDRGQDRVGVDWIGSALSAKSRLRPADPQWADFIRSKNLNVLGSVPDLNEVPPPVANAPDAGVTEPVTPAELTEAAVSGTATVPLLLAAARGLLRTNRIDDALSALRRAEAREPGNLEVQLYLGRALDRLGRSADAADAFAAASRIDPENIDARYGRALSLIRLGRVTTARPLIEALAESRPDDTHVQRLVAIYREKAGDDAGAVEALRKAATAASENGEDQKNLGNAQALRGEYADAVIALRKAAAADPADASVQLQLGTALGYTGDHAGAETALLEATKLAPADGIGWRNLAAVREHMKDVDGAVAAWEALLKNDQTPYDRGAVQRRIRQLKTVGFAGADAGVAEPKGAADGGG